MTGTQSTCFDIRKPATLGLAWLGAAAAAIGAMGHPAFSADVASTVSALRISGEVTGGTLSPSDPVFQQMVASIQGGDYYGAALAAAQTPAFASYLARRMAMEMMNPALNASGVTDNDATTFLIANMIGVGGLTANISKWWSNNYTCLVNVAGNSTPQHILSLTAAQLAAVNFNTDLVCSQGQAAQLPGGGAVQLPSSVVGGYVTLSDRAGDTSLAQYGATAGTNLRYIESVWEISMGLTLADMASVNASPQDVPRFVPENDPNFLQGQGQPACISCHGGGASSVDHGYATVADIFNFDPSLGLTYNASPTTSTMKSLGSNAGNRSRVLNCNMTTFTTCNPDSNGVGTSQAWDVGATWSQSGLLARMGWTGPLTGQGLNALGTAVGQASLVYQNLVNRVISEVCPLGSFSPGQISTIAQKGQSADDLRVIVASVASDPSCR